MRRYEATARNAHGAYLALFYNSARTDAEQIAAADDFRQEMVPVMPRMISDLDHWNWLANEARAVLEVDGAL